MLIRNSLSPDTIEILDRASDAADIIVRLAERIARAGKLDGRRIQQAALERERTRSTGFANGTALPHCRLAELSRFVTGLAVLRHPLLWDAEGHYVDRVMLITGPLAAVSDHLRILANGSQILDSPTIRDRLQSAPEAHSAYELIAAAEEAIERRRAAVGVLTEVRRDTGEDSDFLRPVAERFNW